MEDESEERGGAQPTKDFLSSGGIDFNGEELKPFTTERMAVAIEMGMTWPYVKDEDRVTLEFEIQVPSGKKGGKLKKQTVRIEHYRQSWKDSLFALWLCRQTESRVDRAGRKLKEARDEAYAWAKKIAFLPGTELAGVALTLWLQICAEINRAQSKPVMPKSKGGAPPEETDSGEL